MISREKERDDNNPDIFHYITILIQILVQKS